jgi:tRNA (cytidine/uridine-2'-O-)-methyltransferase
LPRHFTVTAWPTAIGFTFTSIEDSASVSAAGLRLLMNGQAVAIVPTAAMAPVATMRKSRRVGSPWAPAGILEDAIVVYVPRGIELINEKAPYVSSLCWSQGLTVPRCDSVPHISLFRVADGRSKDAMRLALFEPDIPQNLGAFIRLSACLDVPLDIVEPCGFPLDDKRVRRAAMDYYGLASFVRHDSWSAFCRARSTAGRLVLLTTKGSERFPDIDFDAADILLFGRESAGVPEEVHAVADVRLRIPLQKGSRSLNVATAAAMVLSEGLRQTSGFARLS